MSPEQCTKIDYDEIEKCDIFIAFPGIPASPGTHIEIGWASAFNKKIIFLLADDEEKYAYLIRGLHKVTDVTYIIYHSIEEYYDKLDKPVRYFWLPAEIPDPHREPGLLAGSSPHYPRNDLLFRNLYSG